MLVLTRKTGQRLVIDDKIVITITELKYDNVRIAIEAPKDIKIYRGEIYDAIVTENREASDSGQAGSLDMLKAFTTKAEGTKK